MSCLLYNLAIEPLIKSIQSAPQKGFNISADLSKVLVKVYADDTTVFLGPDDDPRELQKCLDLFCKVSTAKFNDLKTEIIPLGSTEAGFMPSLLGQNWIVRLNAERYSDQQAWWCVSIFIVEKYSRSL